MRSIFRIDGNKAPTRPIPLPISTINGKPIHPHHAPPPAKSLASPRPRPSLPLICLKLSSIATKTVYPMPAPMSLSLNPPEKNQASIKPAQISVKVRILGKRKVYRSIVESARSNPAKMNRDR